MSSINHSGVECTEDKCEGVVCANGFCDAGSCFCDSGYVKIEDICVDLCTSFVCENGFCDAGKCSCKEGYISNGNSCGETCDLNPCEVLILVCSTKLCNKV